MNITNLVNKIAQQAMYGPAAKGQTGRVVNSLSPAFQALVAELVRDHMVNATKQAQRDIAKQISLLREDFSSPENVGFALRIDVTAAHINEILHNLYK